MKTFAEFLNEADTPFNEDLDILDEGVVQDAVKRVYKWFKAKTMSKEFKKRINDAWMQVYGDLEQDLRTQFAGLKSAIRAVGSDGVRKHFDMIELTKAKGHFESDQKWISAINSDPEGVAEMQSSGEKPDRFSKAFDSYMRAYYDLQRFTEAKTIGEYKYMDNKPKSLDALYKVYNERNEKVNG